MAGPKETAYDERIAPLVTQIIALCREHKINAFATFALDKTEEDGCVLWCTTSLPRLDPDDVEGSEKVAAHVRTACPRTSIMAMTITTGRRDSDVPK